MTGITLSVPENHIHEYREQPEPVDSDDEICSVVSNEHDDDDDEKDTAVYYNLVDWFPGIERKNRGCEYFNFFLLIHEGKKNFGVNVFANFSLSLTHLTLIENHRFV